MKNNTVYHVNKALQIILVFIPLINLWGWWRVGKLWHGIGLNVLGTGISYATILFDIAAYSVNDEFGIIITIVTSIAAFIPAIYFMNKWTDQRNALYHEQVRSRDLENDKE